MSTTAPELFSALIDDAALFPPGSLPLPEAVPAHLNHRNASYAASVGPFLCTDLQLGELGKTCAAHLAEGEPLDLGLIVTGGAGGIEPALTWVGRDDLLELRGLEITLRDEPDLARNARRVAMVLDGELPEDVPAYVEVPRVHGWEDALDVLAETGHHAKLRTGGVEAHLFPAPEEVAAFMEACLDREVAFKATAGLHHLAAHHDPATGFDHFGFGNLMLAVRAGLDGVSAAEISDLLVDRDADRIATALADLSTDRARSIRRWFASFGSCSVLEPIEDLSAHGLLEG